MKALGRRKKSHKKVALEVVKEADKEGEEGGSICILWTVHAAYHDQSVHQPRSACTHREKQAHTISSAIAGFCISGQNCLH